MTNQLKLLEFSVRQSSTKALQPNPLFDWELGTNSTQSWNLEGDKVSYTSLRDVMSSVLAKCKQGSPHHEIVCCSRTPIKNRLVEKAARAYLQPTVAQHTRQNQTVTRDWHIIMRKTAISSLQYTLQRSIEACASLFSGLNWFDLSQSVRHPLGILRPKVYGILNA